MATFEVTSGALEASTKDQHKKQSYAGPNFPNLTPSCRPNTNDHSFHLIINLLSLILVCVVLFSNNKKNSSQMHASL